MVPFSFFPQAPVKSQAHYPTMMSLVERMSTQVRLNDRQPRVLITNLPMVMFAGLYLETVAAVINVVGVWEGTFQTMRRSSCGQRCFMLSTYRLHELTVCDHGEPVFIVDFGMDFQRRWVMCFGQKS